MIIDDLATICQSPRMELETGIPIPRSRGSLVRYPFADMQIGASFTRPKEQQRMLRVAASHYKARNPGWHYESRIQGDVIRLWRTAPPETEGTAK